MRIAISTQTFNRVMGGGGVFAVQLAGGLAEAGHEVMVMTPRGSAGRVEKNLDGRIRLAEVRSVSLEPFYRGIYIPVSPTKEVERLLDAFQPDVVHLMDHYPLSHSAAALARKRGLPLMATNNFLPDNIILNFKPFMLFHPQVKSLLWKMALDVFNQASLVATPSEEGVAILRAQGLKTPATAISSGYDPARFHLDPTIEVERYRQGFRIDTVKPVFLYVGRLENEKHVDCLIRALAQIERKDVQLAIGGKGPLEGRLRQLVKELGLEERVIFTGFIPGPDLPCLLNSVDFFAMAGDTEL